MCRLKSHDALYPPLWQHHDVPLWFLPPLNLTLTEFYFLSTLFLRMVPKTFRQNFKGNADSFLSLFNLGISCFDTWTYFFLAKVHKYPPKVSASQQSQLFFRGTKWNSETYKWVFNSLFKLPKADNATTLLLVHFCVKYFFGICVRIGTWKSPLFARVSPFLTLKRGFRRPLRLPPNHKDLGSWESIPRPDSEGE